MKNSNLFIAGLAAVMAFSACNSSTDNTQDTLLKGAIPDSTARRMVTNFTPRAYRIKKGGIIRPDTRCVWFSAKQIRDFAQKVMDENGDGIRFYLASYDSTKRPDLPNIKDAYLNYGTLVMVSTTPMGKGNHLDYYTDQLTSGKRKGGIIMAVPENQGELCPPPANCSTAGATLLP